MDYREFLNAVAEALQNRIDGKYRVIIDSAENPAQDRPVLRVIDKRSGVGFTVPTEGAFEKLKDGREMDEVIDGITGHVNRGIREMPAVDTSVLDDYGHMPASFIREAISNGKKIDQIYQRCQENEFRKEKPRQKGSCKWQKKESSQNLKVWMIFLRRSFSGMSSGWKKSERYP